MKNYLKALITFLLVALILFGCGSEDADSNPSENNDEAATSKNNQEEEAESESNDLSNEKENVLSEIHSFEEEEDIDLENISINYDGSVVFFNEVDDSGEDEIITPYFIYNGDLIDASSIDNHSNCRFYSTDEENTYYFSGVCYDENDDRVAVVYDVETNTITHSTDRGNLLTALADGRVLFTKEYSGDGTIYELTDNGEEVFLEFDNMTDILGISADTNSEVFFIYGADTNNKVWNAFVYDTANDTDPVLFDEIPDDEEAKTVEGKISPNGKYIMFRHRGVSGGEHYNYVDNFIFNRETEEEIELGQGFDLNFVRPNGYVFDDVRKYGPVIYNTESATWLAPEEKDFSFMDSLYANEYINEEERNRISLSRFQGLSGDGEKILLLDSFRGSDGGEDYFKFHIIQTEDYIHSLEEQDVEIDFEPSPFDEKGA